MKIKKNTVAFLLCIIMLIIVDQNCEYNYVYAKVFSLATPKVTVKTINDSTGIKFTIDKTKDADGYDIFITGIPENFEYCEYFKYKDTNGDVYMRESFTKTIYKNGEEKRTIFLKNLQPGQYTTKVCSWNRKKTGTKVYSKWSKEKKLTLKDAATKGYSDTYDFSKAKRGDIVKFGAYEQDLDYTNGKEEIEWIVIKKTKDSVLLLSKYALDRLPYNKELEMVTWESCTLRKWLNDSFIRSAFNKTELSMIKSTELKNYDSSEWETIGGKDTNDKVFLLSEYEITDSDFGFSTHYDEWSENRRCAFCWDKNKKGREDFQTLDGEFTCWWWLRSPGSDQFSASSIHKNGCVITHEYIATYIGCDKIGVGGVRPALYVKLKSED